MSATKTTYLTLVFKPTSPEQRREILNLHDWTAASNDHVIYQRDKLQEQLESAKEALQKARAAENYLRNALNGIAHLHDKRELDSVVVNYINNSIKEYGQQYATLDKQNS